jgi:hypothetical protein
LFVTARPSPAVTRRALVVAAPPSAEVPAPSPHEASALAAKTTAHSPPAHCTRLEKFISLEYRCAAHFVYSLSGY